MQARSVSVLAVHLALAAHLSFAQTVLYDGFEYTDSPTDHGWLFQPSGDNASVFTTDSFSRSGSQSLVMDSLDDDEQHLQYVFGCARTDVLVEIYMYDDLAAEGYNTLDLLDDCCHKSTIGLRTSSSTTHYGTSNNGLLGWEVTSVARTVGLHKFSFTVRPDGTDFFIDDVLVRSAPLASSIQYLGLDCGSHGSVPELGTVRFDDVSVIGLGAGTPPADMLSADSTAELPALPDRRFDCVTLPWDDPDDVLVNPALAALLFYRFEWFAGEIMLTKRADTVHVLER